MRYRYEDIVSYRVESFDSLDEAFNSIWYNIFIFISHFFVSLDEAYDNININTMQYNTMKYEINIKISYHIELKPLSNDTVKW